MKRLAILLTVVFFNLPLAAQQVRPKITGIDHVRLYVSSVDAARNFYKNNLGLPEGGAGCAGLANPCFPVNTRQQVELQPATASTPQNWLAEVAFATDNLDQMRGYLLAHGVTPGTISKDASGARHFELRDPEGNPIAFVQRAPLTTDWRPAPQQIATKLIHAGFVVKDLAAENRFYRDLLGFRLYWFGGFKDDGTDWYEIQVPDGGDWIEYMLNIPPTADHKELGVQNHFSLGVKNAPAAAAQLRARGLKSFDGPEIGRDGKNSLDAYDPDLTRVEVMEFTPAQQPCCHAYEASHPSPQ